MLQPGYQRPAQPLPANWQVKPVAADATAWPDRDWWKGFGSEELGRYMAEAQAASYDLQAAAARVAQARANRQVAATAVLPALTLDAGASRAKSPGSSSGSSFSVGPRIAYEVDVWGRNRAGIDAADANVLASEFDREAVRLALMADLATTYFQILSFNDRLSVARQNLSNAERLMKLIDVQKAAGKVSGLEVRRQRTQVASAKAAIPPLLQGKRVAQDALALLLARNPGELPEITASLRPAAVPTVPLGLPSMLLDRRPDLRRAEASLVAANANIAAARAAMLPSINLSARGGLSSSVAGRLLRSGSGFYSFGIDLLATIFDGGRLAAQVDVARGRQEELVADYRKSILTAFGEVENALSGIDQFDAQEQAQREVVEHARESYRLAELRYKAGADDFLSVLDAQRTLINAEAALDPVRLSRFNSTVDLYRALGGGWQESVRDAALR